MSHQSNNHQPEQILQEQDLDQVVGGASAFLKGEVVAALKPNYELAEFQGHRGPGSFAARSQTTLGCWEDCTYNISSC